MGRISVVVVALAVALTLTSGCQPRRSGYDSPPQQESYFLHEIKFPGETMGLIANWYTGSTDNYTLIAAANPAIDLNRMKIGDVIRIPERLIVRREELPARVVRNAPKGNDAKESQGRAGQQQEVVATPTQPAREETPLADQIARESGELDLSEQQPAALPFEVAEQVTPSAEVVPTVQPEARRDVRIKTRDELLEELLK